MQISWCAGLVVDMLGKCTLGYNSPRANLGLHYQASKSLQRWDSRGGSTLGGWYVCTLVYVWSVRELCGGEPGCVPGHLRR